jgi:hypothetical protein
MPAFYTNVHLAGPSVPYVPSRVNPWALPKGPSCLGLIPLDEAKARQRGEMIVSRPPRSSSLRSEEAQVVAVLKPSMTLIPLSEAIKRDDIKYREESFETKERALHLAFIRCALRA